MKKKLLIILVACIALLAACTQNSDSDKKAKKDDKGTFTYKSENGDVELPKNPKRVLVLSTYAGNVMALDTNLVGVDSWSKMNPKYDKYLKDVEEVTDEDLEKIIELKPDLIIGLSTIKNYKKLKDIAPTVTFEYGKLNYLDQHIEIGKVLNKEKEAQAWVEDFKNRAAKAEKKIKENIGDDKTFTVIESFDKQLYVFGDHWGRGTEVIYQALNLKMPEKVKEMVEKDGYYAMSTEVLSDYVGDYLVVSKDKDTENSFQKTKTYKNIPAVKDSHVMEHNQKEIYFNDPITLDAQLKYYTEKLSK